MAGCGWASVASQYIGAALFAWLVYRRREDFGLPQAWDAFDRSVARQRSALLPQSQALGGSQAASAAAKQSHQHHHKGQHRGSRRRCGGCGVAIAKYCALVRSLDW